MRIEKARIPQWFFRLGVSLALAAVSGSIGLHGQARCVSGLDCVQLFQADPPKKPYTRKDWDSLTPAEVCSIVKGVAAMKALPATNPLSWQYQANIHGTNKAAAARLEAEDCCQHSGWYFLPWHRMEIFYFERILRAMSGDNNLVVPYWNFTVLDSDPTWPMKRAIPRAFRTPKITCGGMEIDNPLYDAKRNMGTMAGCGINDGVPLCQAVVNWTDAFATDKFWDPTITNGPMTFGGAKTGTGHFSDGRATGQIEGQPHNPMHVVVGGPGGDLTDPDGAATDPIFWPFHVNIDRAWYCWDKKFNKPTTYPPFTEPWWSTQFKFFDVKTTMTKGPDGKDVVTVDSRPVCLSAKQVVLAAVNLRYKYDSCNPYLMMMSDADEQAETIATLQTAEEESSSIVASVTSKEAMMLGTNAATVSIELPGKVQQAIGRVLPKESAYDSIVLSIEGIEVNKPVSGAYEIYVNLPKNTAPDPASRYFAGNLAFFGIAEHHHNGEAQPEARVAGGTRSFDITRVVRRLAASHEWTGNKVSITFAVPPQPAISNDACPMCIGLGALQPDEHVAFAQLTLDVISLKSGAH
jgi:Common central domain of tyrosinase